MFIGKTSPVIGHTYTVVVEAPGYETVTAHYTQPPVVEIEDFHYEVTGESKTE
jgi:hypothetical protein